MVHGIWYMIYRIWYIVYGTWYTWYTVHGTWYMGYGCTRTRRRVEPSWSGAGPALASCAPVRSLVTMPSIRLICTRGYKCVHLFSLNIHLFDSFVPGGIQAGHVLALPSRSRRVRLLESNNQLGTFPRLSPMFSVVIESERRCKCYTKHQARVPWCG